jgi:hypothetical protein
VQNSLGRAIAAEGYRQLVDLGEETMRLIRRHVPPGLPNNELQHKKFKHPRSTIRDLFVGTDEAGCAL